ncbi:MAG: lipase [Leptospira sp.]|nr:lipase [Leptospira sp.]
MRSWMRYLLLLFLFIGFTELGLRFIDPPSLSYYRNIKLLHRYHPEYYVTLGENLDIYVKHYSNLWEGRFTTNSLGFRGSPEPDSTSPKLACLGDSLVMGFGVSDEDTFCYQLNGFDWDGKKFQSQNLAVDAYGSLGSAKRLKESAQKLPLDTVLFFVSPNDFTVPPGLVEQGVQADDIVEKQRENDEDYRKKFFIQFEATRYSYLLQAMKLANEQLSIKRHLAKVEFQNEISEAKNPGKYLSNSFYTFPDKKTCTKADSPENLPNQTTISSPISTATPQSCHEPILPDSGCIATVPDYKELPALPDETIYAYNIMLQVVRENNIRLIVVFLPMQNEDIRCYNNGKHSPLYNYALRAKGWFENNEIETIDLITDSSEICPIGDFFIPGDGHLTKKGNHWVAETLKRRLQEKKDRN